jgi:benzoate-CoA ligase family protein
MSLDPFALPESLNLTEVFLYAQARQHPARPALYFGDQTITYGGLVDLTDRATAVYRKLGLEQEQRVLLMLPDVPQFASAWFAAVKAGGVVSAVNPDLKGEEVRYYLNYTRAKILVCDAITLPALEEVRAECPHLKHVLVVGGAGKHLDYDAELQRATPDPTFAATHKDDTAVWLYTSGSTGFPKAAVHKHHDFVFNALTYALPLVGYCATDICVSVPRLAFGYALGTNLLFPLLAGGATALFREKPTAEKLFEVMKKHRPTLFTGVPTALNQIVNAPGLEAVDFSSLRIALSAGEALPAELYSKWKERTGVEVLDGIGSAEMFHIFITNRRGDVKLGSLGRVVEGYEAKVCDDEGASLPDGEIGTLWIKGDSMALEYWQQHEKSKSTFRGDWCVSADKFRRDDKGYFFFCGRGDDMLKVSGKWLSPVEVENELLKHPAVREAAVISFQDKDGLDKPKAFVALHPGQAASDALGEELKKQVREALAPYKAPRQVVFLDALPRSDRGKVLKGALRE